MEPVKHADKHLSLIGLVTTLQNPVFIERLNDNLICAGMT